MDQTGQIHVGTACRRQGGTEKHFRNTADKYNQRRQDKSDYDTCLVAISRAQFLDTIWSNTSVCRVIILELIERLNNSAQNMVNSMYLDASGRLAFTLVNLTTNSRQKCMNIRVTQSALAASSGMARQTAAKILGEWRRQGIISTERGRLCILNLDALLDINLNSEIDG